MANKHATIYKTSQGWASKVRGNSRASFTGKTQAEVYAKQRNSFKNSRGGEITVQGRNGRFVNKNTISPMPDHCPPRG